MASTDKHDKRPEDYLYIYIKVCIETAKAIGFGPQVDLTHFRELVLEAVRRLRIMLRRAIQSGHEGDLILLKREFVRVLGMSRDRQIGKAYRRVDSGRQEEIRRRVVTDIGQIGVTPDERRAILDPSLWNLRQLVEEEPYPGADVALACIVNRLELQEQVFAGTGVTVRNLCLALGAIQKPPK